MPFGFNYNSTSEGAHLKFLRVHTSSASGSNQGYNDWYINPSNRVSGDNNGTHKFIFEGEQRWSDFGTEADRPQFGVWEVYEMYLKFDNVSTDNGGQALVRVWKNGVLKGEFTNRRTLSNSDSYSDRTHIFTYWNGGAPKTQHMWLDDVVVTSDTPDAVDSHGNPYVGAGDFRALNPPISPPSFTQNVK
jgi:hypothetical protein